MSFFLVLTFLLSACTAGSTGVSRFEQNDATRLRLGFTTAPASLDFTTNSGAAIGQALLGNVYEGLVRIDENAQIQPALATSWEIDDTATQYTFHLQKGVQFSNGSPFDAHTAKFSLERTQTEAWTNPQKAKLAGITDIQVVDDATLVVTLAQPSNTFLWNLGGVVGAMFSPDAVDALATTPVGTGPYLVEQWAVGTSLTFAANPKYWGPQPQSSSVELRYMSDATALSNAVRSGQLDAVIGLQAPELLDEILADDNLAVTVGTTNGEVLLSMNNQRAPFDDLRVRQAVFYGIDRQAIRDTTWEGYGVDTAGAPVAPTDPWFAAATAIDPYPYNPDLARQLLADAGATGTEITITVPSLPYALAASELLYTQLHAIGFQVRLETVEFPATWLNQVHRNHDYDMSLIAHVEARDIPTMFGSDNYYLGFQDAETQALLAQADTEFVAGDPEATAQEYTTAMTAVVARIMSQAPALTLYNLPNIVVARPNVTGLPANLVADSFPLAEISRQE